MDDLDGFRLCGHHDKASAAKLTEEGYQRVEAVVNVEPQTLVG